MCFTEISMDMKLFDSCALYANISFTFENIFSEIKKIICILTIIAQKRTKVFEIFEMIVPC